MKIKFTRLICIVCALSMLFMLLCPSVFAEGDEEFTVQHMGDVNEDGEVTLDDVRLILYISAGAIDNDFEYSDVDGDGSVTTLDAVITLKIISGIIKPLDKTGENLISESSDNEFIALISVKYKVDSKALVAIYAVPDKGNNFVLQFKKVSLNKYGRSPDDLEKVYQVDKERNICIATKTGIGCSGVSSAESILVFYMVKEIIMPQHPDVFTDV